MKEKKFSCQQTDDKIKLPVEINDLELYYLAAI
jgi:hypothetical protein